MATGTITTNASTSHYVSKQQMSNANARLHLAGTWDGATVTVELRVVGGDTWRSVSNGAYTADADPILNLPVSTDVRLTSTGIGGSTSIVWELV